VYSKHNGPAPAVGARRDTIPAGHKKAALVAAFMFSGTTSVAVWVGEPSIGPRPAGDEGAGGSARKSVVSQTEVPAVVAGLFSVGPESAKGELQRPVLQALVGAEPESPLAVIAPGYGQASPRAFTCHRDEVGGRR
jgi:hypothetical protein